MGRDLGVPVGSGRFLIDNIPFYAKNLSCGDVVEAEKKGNDLIFKCVVEPSTNSTIRIVIYDLMEEAEIRDNLLSMKCSVEGTGTPGLIAVNVPKASLEEVTDFVAEAFANEKLDFEEGALR
ncbi:MAG TPA: DUF4265 domain-containing protein [Allosphingosinicella sp.]